MITSQNSDLLRQIEIAASVLEKPGFYYVRLNRPKVPTFQKDPVPFEIGKAYCLKNGSQITLIAVGDKVWTALEVAEQWRREL